MNNFVLRSITGICLVIIISLAVISGPYSFFSLLLVINLLALQEFYGLFRSLTLQPRAALGILLSVAILVTSLLVFLEKCDRAILLVNIPLISIIFFSELFRRAGYPFQNIAITFLGIIYVTLPLVLFSFTAFLPLSDITYHPHVILGYFFILWASDTGAYASGKVFGRHKLFKRISPAKTWEGSIGGTFSALLVAYFISCFYTGMQLTDWLITALVIVVTGTLGDLTKSLMKRSLDLKDSGNILPGHGGMLDRFDSLLGSAPFVFCYIVLSGLLD